MSAPELTRLFPDHIKPTRSGVYRVKGPDGSFGYAYFHKRAQAWGWRCDSVKEANRDRDTRGASQAKKWRGLASDPRGAK